ncbi:MAG: hypothetical protein H6734_20340 [Alphaproteobacteria bacterium]|nr:hypothetical protein [Alphaproteobacteria bacterium]
MADHIVEIADGFWNVRGSFKIAGFVDIGTQMSLVRRPDGRFLLLDCYTPTGAVRDELMERTDGGKAVDAILNLHPFHTIHCKAVHELFPDAKLYGTRRHAEKKPDLPWEPVRTEDPELAELFPELVFSVPRGVHLVPANENLHFASVLAFHPATRTLHVDDTLMFTKLPFIGGLSFHPTLAKVLEERPGAVDEFRAWAAELVELCRDVDTVCAAHTRPLRASDGGPPVAERVQKAIADVEAKLAAHAKKHG